MGAPDPTRPRTATVSPRVWLGLTTLMVLCIAGWAVPALLMTGRGFAVEDEGTYLVTYRFWDTSPYLQSGASFFYGPVFHLLDENIAALRVFRLVCVVASNAWFGYAFCTWLARHRGAEGATARLALVAGTATLAAMGGFSFLWSPLTPGYYDVTPASCLALLALLLTALRRPGRVPLWIPALSGGLSFVLVVAKWPALTVVLIVHLAAALLLTRRDAVRYVAVAAGGFAAAAAVFHVAMFPLGEATNAIWQSSRTAATGKNSLSVVLADYVSSSAEFLVGALLLALPAIAAYSLGHRARRGGGDGTLRPLFVGSLLLIAVAPFAFGWRGGAENGRAAIAAAVAALLVAVLAATRPRRDPALATDSPSARRTEWIMTATLFVVPFGQAAGTNVPLLLVAGTCLGMWVAAILVFATRPGRAPQSLPAVLACLALLATVVAALAATTTLLTPFKTSGYSASTSPVDELGGLRVTPARARQYDALITALAPYVERGTTPILQMDTHAGLVYLLGGVPVGSAWTSGDAPQRTADLISLACEDGRVDRDLTPVVLLTRPLDDAVIEAMRMCGHDLETDVRPLDVPDGPPEITVLVPVG